MTRRLVAMVSYAAVMANMNKAHQGHAYNAKHTRTEQYFEDHLIRIQQVWSIGCTCKLLN